MMDAEQKNAGLLVCGCLQPLLLANGDYYDQPRTPKCTLQEAAPRPTLASSISSCISRSTINSSLARLVVTCAHDPSICAHPLEHVQVAVGCGRAAGLFVPQAPGGTDPLQYHDGALGGSVATGARVPRTSPGPQPLEHCQMAALSSGRAGQLGNELSAASLWWQLLLISPRMSVFTIIY